MILREILNTTITALRTSSHKALRAKQIVTLFTSMILGMFAGIGVSVITTRLLTPQIYGDLKFVMNICSFLLVFVTYGLFYTGAREIAKQENMNRKHQLIGAMMVIALYLTGIFVIILFAGSWFENTLFNNKLGYIFRVFAPLLFIYPFEQYCENMLAGDNKIYNLSLFRIGPKIFYLASCAAWHFYIYPLSLNSAFGLYLLSMAGFISLAVQRLKPRFDGLKENLKYLWKENKSYGLSVYFGAMASLASAQLGGISLGYFVDNTHVGFFSLAITAAMPLAMIPNTVGTTYFKDFANMKVIPEKVVYLTMLLSAVALALFLILIKPLVILLYTREYLAVVPIAYYIAIGSTLHGFGDFYNRFISAHGYGRLLRNSNFMIGFINIVGYTLIVYFFGINGAAYTKLFAGLIYLGMMYYSYKLVAKYE